jgi:hypothetical protein
MKRIIRHSQLSDPEGANALCTDKMCLALSSVLIYPTTHERMTGKRVACVQMCAFVPVLSMLWVHSCSLSGNTYEYTTEGIF